MSALTMTALTQTIALGMAELSDDDLQQLADRLAPLLDALRDVEREEPDGWLTSKQAADYLGLSVHAVRRLSAERTIPHEQTGERCKLWFRRSDLDAWRRGTSTNRASTPLPGS
ncbi:MAG: helix-turn-helix domain-containing protein [Solirubrobacteraceae bacterium]